MNFLIAVKFIFDLIRTLFLKMFTWHIGGVSIGAYIVGFLLAGILISFIMNLIDVPRVGSNRKEDD